MTPDDWHEAEAMAKRGVVYKEIDLLALFFTRLGSQVEAAPWRKK